MFRVSEGPVTKCLLYNLSCLTFNKNVTNPIAGQRITEQIKKFRKTAASQCICELTNAKIRTRRCEFILFKNYNADADLIADAKTCGIQ